MAFWKIVVAPEAEQRLRAYGFIFDQADAIKKHGWERKFDVGKFATFHVPLDHITAKARVQFDQVLHDADPLNGPASATPLRLDTIHKLTLE